MYNEETISDAELAERWKVDKRVLAKLRTKHLAPAYFKVGQAVRYPMSEILKIEAVSLENFND
jgi:hypothetical protein